MNPKEINWDEWEEISYKDFRDNGMDMCFFISGDDTHYFKRKKPEVKYPIVFEGCSVKIYVTKMGLWFEHDLGDKINFFTEKNQNNLIQAIDKWKELQK